MSRWHRQTADHAATSSGGFRRNLFDRAPALHIGNVITADALVDDVVVTLPPCVPNAGRLYLIVRIDATGTFYDVTVEPDDPSTESIAGASSYGPIVSQYGNVLLLATSLGVWIIVAEGGAP